MTSNEHYEVLFSQQAEDDLEGIHDYLVRHASPDAANGLIDTFQARVAALEQFPWRGSIPQELEGQGRDDVRQIVSGPYRLFYSVTDRRVVVLLIADGRRDMQSLLRERLLTPPGSPR